MMMAPHLTSSTLLAGYRTTSSCFREEKEEEMETTFACPRERFASS